MRLKSAYNSGMWEIGMVQSKVIKSSLHFPKDGKDFLWVVSFWMKLFENVFNCISKSLKLPRIRISVFKYFLKKLIHRFHVLMTNFESDKNLFLLILSMKRKGLALGSFDSNNIQNGRLTMAIPADRCSWKQKALTRCWFSGCIPQSS